ncbi:acyl-CoA thioesterase [Paracoccus sp. M683]|uniref:acyl-CoA thioesterase n=1 Tax=Paracoccus sp. M683 TaxID=2594268 RepID=UPI00117E7D93|nr:acyl-CoA thioesterase [Paracoccus sp. M683]TRW95061.1 acyl-CoA thioesterase [Paracoccus sp. M683]
MAYSRVIQIEFCHCDPAGIVFYPRYAEMVNHVVENYFIDVLKHPFHQMVAAGQGIPAVRLEMDFRKPSRLGDRVEWVLGVEHLGRSSIRFRLNAEDRIDARVTVVWMEAGFKPSAIPDTIRKILEADHA